MADCLGDDDDHLDRDALTREAGVREQRHFDSGYREGIDVGRQQTVQNGFDVGYQSGVQIGLRMGQLHGKLQTLQSFSARAGATGQTLQEIAAALAMFKALEKATTVALCYELVGTLPTDAPAGVQEQFSSSKTGTERWQGLATLINVDLATSHASIETALGELEATADLLCNQLIAGGESL